MHPFAHRSVDVLEVEFSTPESVEEELVLCSSTPTIISPVKSPLEFKMETVPVELTEFEFAEFTKSAVAAALPVSIPAIDDVLSPDGVEELFPVIIGKVIAVDDELEEFSGTGLPESVEVEVKTEFWIFACGTSKDVVREPKIADPASTGGVLVAELFAEISEFT